MVLLAADQIQSFLFDALTHMPNPVLMVPSNAILALQIAEYHYFRFEPHASACYKTACVPDHIDAVTFSMPAHGCKISKGILNPRSRTKMTNQKSYPCLILKLSLMYNSTDASPIGDPDFHNWGKLAEQT